MPVPELVGAHDLRIRLHAAGVNPIDAKVRQSALYYPDRLPAVLGCDGAGIVDATGPAVTRFRPGDAVYFFGDGIGGTQGAYAEFIVMHEDYVARKPERLSMTDAAALPLALITAWEALFYRGALMPSETVLIHAAAGGVGHIAVQLAAGHGARVIATGSSQAAEFLQDLGARHVIDYRARDFVEAVREITAGAGVALVLDAVGGATFNRSFEALAPYGRIATLLLSAFDEALLKQGRIRNATVHYVLVLSPILFQDHAARVRQRLILEIGARLVDSGRLRVHVSAVFPLSQARAAHERIETGHQTGKLVLRIE
ncbi:MAG: zinc-binding dehydrogenase [Acidiferrobacteraceae bacterium]